MAVNLANDEVLVSNYEYAHVKTKGGASGSNTITKKLMVTNKRIIHQVTGSGFGREEVAVDEMPIESAKYVSTYYGKKSFPIFLIIGIIAIIAAVALFVLGADKKGGSAGGNPMTFLAIIPIVFGIIFIIIFLVKKDYVISCDIASEGVITPVMGISSRQQAKVSKKTRSMKITAKVTVDHVAAKQLAEELPSIILNIQSTDFNVKPAQNDQQ